MADTSISNGIVKYSSRDYQSIYSDFLSAVPTMTELWNGESDSDPGIVLAKYIANVADQANNHYIVYAHILPNRSAYVGMTGISVQDRSGNQGKGYRNESPEFYATIQTVGWDNIRHITLVQNLDYETALNIEVFFTKLFEIAGYKMFNKKYGFNGSVVSDETRSKISKANKGKVRTAAQRKAISDQKVALYKNHPEVKQKLRESAIRNRCVRKEAE